jgi:hypothetical protein
MELPKLKQIPKKLGRLSPSELKKHILSTYLTLRFGIAVITLAFPFAVFLSGWISHVDLQSSLSAYYWADEAGLNTPRTVFVGGLFAIGAFLYLYKGYTRAENIVLNFAALFGVGVALVPTPQKNGWDPGIWHAVLAIATFACLAYVVLFQAKKTLHELPVQTASGPVTKRYSHKWYVARYNVIGSVLLASPITAAILDRSIGRNSYTFFIESAGVMAFGWYWLAKSSEIKRSSAEHKAVAAQMSVQ